MLNKIAAVLCIASIIFMIGCAAHTHQVGKGAQGSEVIEQRQWYVLWGLVPMNDVDTQAMAGGATDYQITTAVTALDFVISIFTSAVTIDCRTVTVEK